MSILKATFLTMYCRLSYKINKQTKQFVVESSNFQKGKDVVLFDNTLCSNELLLNDGYMVCKFPGIWKQNIERNIKNFILDKMFSSGVTYDNKQTVFKLENYHNFVTDKQHQEIVNSFRGGAFGLGGIPFKYLGVPTKELDQFVSTSISAKRSISCEIKKFGFVFGKFWIRIVRPNSNDNNPPHKDSHLKRLRKCVNIYLPIAGSNELSSLPLIPGSHKESESKYLISNSPSYVNGKKNTVPCIVEREGGLDMICPDPKPNEIMIFTPHLIHGGGVNSNPDKTRISLEMRFFEK